MRRTIMCGICVVVVASLASAAGTFLREHVSAEPGAFGSSAASIGDVNLDGVSDYAIGARESGNGPLFVAGRVAVYSGASGAFLYEIRGAEGDFLGTSIAALGDVDADGRADFLVGAPNYVGDGAGLGHARVCSGLDGREIRRVTGDAVETLFGWSVAGIGDVTGDGKPDFAVGAPGPDGASPGQVRVYSGADGAEIDALSRSGLTATDNLGTSLAALGDVNKDDVPDFAVGAMGADPARRARFFIGRVLVISGANGSVLRAFNGAAQYGRFGHAIAACGDQDKDGVTDLVVGAYGVSNFTGEVTIWSSRTGRKLFVQRGLAPLSRFGLGVAGLDDVDGDGRPEIAVGAGLDDGVNDGHVSVVSTPKRKILLLHRGAPGDHVGDIVARAGDLDGDGKTELLVGAWDSDKARVFKVDASPVPPPARFAQVVKLLSPTTTIAKGTLRLAVRGSLVTATISATGLPFQPLRVFTADVETGVATNVYRRLGTLAVMTNGRGSLARTGQYLAPQEFGVDSLAELSGRRVLIRTDLDATLVLTATLP